MKTSRHVQLLVIALIVIFAFFLTIPFEFSLNLPAKYDSLVVYGFVINGLIWFVLLMLEISQRPYSIQAIHWIFCLFFFAFVPLAQYTFKSFPWVSSLSDSVLLRANVILFLWTIFFKAGCCVRAPVCKNTVGGGGLTLSGSGYYFLQLSI